VPRKPKSVVENSPADSSASSSSNGNASVPLPKKKSQASATTAKKQKAPAPKKAVAKKQSVQSARKTAASRPAEPSDEAIRTRAYFLAERRHQLALPGDSNHDWIEARRQLIEEASKAS
jgi:hypothetical protein